MPRSVPGNFDPTGTIGNTHLFNSSFSLTQVGNNVGQLDPNLLSSYTAINESTAYFKFLTKQINSINVSTFTINPNSPNHEYIIKYLMVTTFILISGLTDEINCDVSYLRIDNDEHSPFRPTKTYKGEPFFNEILNSWAEYLDPELIAFDSNTITPTRMIRVVKINGIPVAYYTSKTGRIAFYPFNTIISDTGAVAGLPGISVNPDTDEWEFDYNKFKGEVLATLTANQKNILAATFQKYADIPNDGNGFKLLLRELNLKVPVGVTPLDGTTAIGVLLPLRVNKYSDPSINMVKQDFPHEDKLNDLLRVPYEKNHAHGMSDHIFYALGYTLPRCKVFTRNGTTWLMVAQVAESIKFIHHVGGNRIVIEPEGIQWNLPLTDPVNLDIEYVDSLGNIIPLGTYTMMESGDGPTDKLFTWDEANLQLICACIPPKTINPFLDKYWASVSEVIPVTRECIDLLEANNCHIAEYTPTANKVSFKIVHNVTDSTVEVVSRNYSSDELVADEITDGMDTIYTDMPRLSVFPYCAFTYNGESVWNKYYFTAIGENAESYLYFKRIKLQYKMPGQVGYTDMVFEKKSLLDENKNTFIAYRAFMELIPNKIFLKDENGRELGVIKVSLPKSIALNPIKKAIMGVDMGSRNSIVAYYEENSGNNPMYIYNYKNLVYDICNSYSPMSEDEWAELLNLHGLSGGLVEKSFTSAVLDYMDEDAPLRKDPMIHGRIIADLSESSFKKIIKLAEQFETPTDNNNNNKLEEIGYHSNFKRLLWDSDDVAGVGAHVALFVKNLCYRLLLNALMQRAGKIELRYTAPNDQVGKILKQHWTDALELAKEEFGIPDTFFTNIVVSNFKLESVALYHHVQNNPANLPYRYSIIIDGGDSTFDVSMIVKDSAGMPHLCQNFSIKYAGYNLLVKSIIDVAMKKNYSLADFVAMWVPKSGIRNRDEDNKKINDLMAPVLKGGVINWDSSKSVEDVVYKLIEKTPHGLCKNSDKAKDVVSLIKLKYLLLLNAIIETCVDSIPDDNSDQPVSVFLYGGANNMAKLLYDDETTIEYELGALMSEWLKRYENTSKTPSIDLRYKVNPDKTELVSGLVQTNTITSKRDAAAVDSKPGKYTQDTYDGIINGMFTKEKDPEFWDGSKCILDIPDITRRAELIGSTPEDVMTQCKGMISGSFREKINVPNRAVYPLATMLYAVREFESTIKPFEDN